MIRRSTIINPKLCSHSSSSPTTTRTLLLLGTTLIIQRKYGSALDWYNRVVPKVPPPSPPPTSHRPCTRNHRTLAFLHTTIPTSKTTTTTTTTKYRSCNCLKPFRFRTSNHCFSSSSSPSTPPTPTPPTPHIAMEPIELSIPCSDGMTLAAQYWKHSSSSSSSSSSSINNISNNTQRPIKRFLCLHGWLDNSASFHLLAPALITHLTTTNHHPEEVHIVALDLPGHGRSSHKSPDGPIGIITEYCVYVREVLDFLGWSMDDDDDDDDDRSNRRTETDSSSSSNRRRNGGDGDDNGGGVVLIGHSMGTGIAIPYAAAFPSHVSSLVLLEGIGPLPRSSSTKNRVSNYVRNAVRARWLYTTTTNNNKKKKKQSPTKGKKKNRNGGGNRVYDSLDQAIAVRIRSTALLPGKQYLSRDAATVMVRRSTVAVTNTHEDDGDDGDDDDDDHTEKRNTNHNNNNNNTDIDHQWNGPVRFVHDPRLHHPSLYYYTHEQVRCFRTDVQCRVCLLTANDGWPLPEKKEEEEDGGPVVVGVEEALKALDPEVHKVLPGSHHFHADPETVGAVVKEIVGFMERGVE